MTSAGASITTKLNKFNNTFHTRASPFNALKVLSETVAHCCRKEKNSLQQRRPPRTQTFHKTCPGIVMASHASRRKDFIYPCRRFPGTRSWALRQLWSCHQLWTKKIQLHPAPPELSANSGFVVALFPRGRASPRRPSCTSRHCEFGFCRGSGLCNPTRPSSTRRFCDCCDSPSFHKHTCQTPKFRKKLASQHNSKGLAAHVPISHHILLLCLTAHPR